MILLDAKSDALTTSSPINIPTSEDEKSSLSFSELLKGIGSKGDEKIIQNGAVLLALDDEKDIKSDKGSSKSSALLNLLKNDETHTQKSEEPLALNPKVTENLSSKDVKTLVFDAKDFLKSKILQSDDYKKSQIQELPKTLKGLVAVAKTLGIDISKISVEEVQLKSETTNVKQLEVRPTTLQTTPKESPKKEILVQLSDVLNAKSEKANVDVKSDVQLPKTNLDVETAKSKKPSTDLKTDVKQEVKSDLQHPKINLDVATAKSEKPNTDLKNDVQHPKTNLDVSTAKSDKLSSEIKQEIKADVQHPKTNLDVAVTKSEKSSTDLKTDVKQEVKSDAKHPKTNLDVATVKNEKTNTDAKIATNEQRTQISQEIKTEEKVQEIKQTPLFKSTTQKELSTEQIVLTKRSSSLPVEEKTPKMRADETLKLLLRGEKPQQSVAAAPSLTADFSVATARVLAPSAQTDARQSLEQLLKGDSAESKVETSNSSKTDGINLPKADSFEVKVNEAKQMIKYLSTDVKTAIEDYKSPFTRIKVQLNPQNLGEVDLTVVQRGKNLHVSLSSNNTAINTLAMNINELRVQLNNSGINNATFNFNSNQDGGNSAGSGQQQQRQNEQKAQDEYSYFENEEQNEEVLSSLEIVVPQYI